MKKFVLLSRGRTGSTAVIDELHRTASLRAAQELFLLYDFPMTPEFDRVYNFVLPFDVWRVRHPLWKRMPASPRTDGVLAGWYLREAEALAERQGASAFGFKVLSNNFDERRFLRSLLKRRGYCAVYLTRNIARQVLSGMVASRSRIYNTTEGSVELPRYTLDPDEFQGLVEWEKRAVEEDCAQLTADGVSFIVVQYEDFCGKRRSFYGRIFDFLGLPTELPPATDYTVLIKDLRYTIENYEAIAERSAALGFALDA